MRRGSVSRLPMNAKAGCCFPPSATAKTGVLMLRCHITGILHPSVTPRFLDDTWPPEAYSRPVSTAIWAKPLEEISGEFSAVNLCPTTASMVRVDMDGVTSTARTCIRRIQVFLLGRISVRCRTKTIWMTCRTICRSAARPIFPSGWIFPSIRWISSLRMKI